MQYAHQPVWHNRNQCPGRALSGQRCAKPAGAYFRPDKRCYANSKFPIFSAGDSAGHHFKLVVIARHSRVDQRFNQPGNGKLEHVLYRERDSVLFCVKQQRRVESARYLSLIINQGLPKLIVHLYHLNNKPYPMKTLHSILLILLSFTLLSSSCKKHVIQPVNQLSLLPPATQTGANTFGCLVNGQAFVPKNRSILQGPILQCNYIYTTGGYHLTVAGGNKNSDGSITDIVVGTDSLAVAQGETLTFKTFVTGNAQASYTLFYYTGGENDYETNNTVYGQLTITKLDPVKQIVSGTFYFNAVNSAGDTVKITDGRFDMPYTR